MTVSHLPRPNETEMDPNGRHILAKFETPSQPGSELQAVDGVMEALRPLNLPERILFRLTTAVAETTMNAMEHGNHYRADQPVKICVLTSLDEIVVQITDHGGETAIPEAEQPDLDAKLTGLQSPRGWGLFLVKNMVDAIEECSDGELHTVELIFKVKKEETE